MKDIRYFERVFINQLPFITVLFNVNIYWNYWMVLEEWMALLDINVMEGE